MFSSSPPFLNFISTLLTPILKFNVYLNFEKQRLTLYEIFALDFAIWFILAFRLNIQ